MKYCFVINVYKDGHLANNLINQLLYIYPDQQIRVLLDGMDVDFKRSERNVVILPFERTKTTDHGSLWLLRYINQGIISGADYIIKLDPDTLVQKEFIDPPASDIFGVLINFPHGKVPAGGIYGMTRKTAKKIIEYRNYFLSLSKYSKMSGYPRYSLNKHPDEEYSEENIIIEEMILCDIIKRLGLSLAPWPGIVNRFRPIYTDIRGLEDMSAIHPYLYQEVI